MDKRVSELRERLWKKKAALQQKENLPVSAEYGLLPCYSYRLYTEVSLVETPKVGVIPNLLLVLYDISIILICS